MFKSLVKIRNKQKIIFYVIICFLLFVLLQNIQEKNAGIVSGTTDLVIQLEEIIITEDEDENYNNEQKLIQNWLKEREQFVAKKNLSQLGKVLLLNKSPPINSIKNNGKNFQILVWKYGKLIENRHLKHFSNKTANPFEKCSVKNCNITFEDNAITSADLVVFHLHRIKSISELPIKQRPNLQQLWTFLTDESPFHTFLNGKVKLDQFNGVFNWSMTYRLDSDVPVPYGRTIFYQNSTEPSSGRVLVSMKKRRDVLVAILGSNCGGNNHRWQYVKQLQKYIQVDVYGHCGNKSCPGHFRQDCPLIDQYLFYLAFENSNCNEYITEKLYWNAFHKNAIPIVMGASKASYDTFLPPNSFLHVNDFAHPSDLAQYLYHLNSTNQFRQFHQWRRFFNVLNEHGYFQSDSYHFCRICEALNYNERTTKIYRNLTQFWSSKADCQPAWDSSKFA